MKENKTRDIIPGSLQMAKQRFGTESMVVSTAVDVFGKEEESRVELIAGGQTLSDEKIQSDIFQGDSLSPLLFISNNATQLCT